MRRSLREARLVLASASPRRAELLRQLGLGFAVVPALGEEVLQPELLPHDLVEGLAHQKASEVALQESRADLVIGADTIVVLDGQVMGKPGTSEAAVRMLQTLSGNWHQVVTGFALIEPGSGRQLSGHAATDVRMRSLGAEEIEAYVRSGEVMDKAGAYAIQGYAAIFVNEIRGCYHNVVGLPLSRLDAAWRELGWQIWN